MFRENIFFLFGSVMAPPSRISAADSRYKLDVYISKCYDAARSLFVEIAA
jgi:hypothetical protein